MQLRLFAIACLVGAAFAGPVQKEWESQCSNICPRVRNHPLVVFQQGVRYVYTYKSENIVTYANNLKHRASIEGKVALTVITPCQIEFKMTDVKLLQKSSHEDQERFIKEMQIPMRFIYQNGKVLHVCRDHRESIHSSNLKKGIISAFITMSKNHTSEEVEETDGLGTCQTKYTSENKGNEKVITKEKNLKTCTNRHLFISSFFQKNISPQDLLGISRFGCKQIISNSNQEINNVSCIEQERMKASMNGGESLLEFLGTLDLGLLYKETANSAELEGPVSQEEILYSHEESRQGFRNEKPLQNHLQKMCMKYNNSMDFTVGSDFFILVGLVKKASPTTISETHKLLRDKKLCSSPRILDMFLDTLPLAGTDAAIKLMVKLLVEHEITGLKAKLWSASFLLILNPTEKTVEAILPLLKHDFSNSAMLGVSSLIYKVCKSRNCDEIPAVKKVVEELMKSLGDNCSGPDEHEIIRVLKIFGNMAYHGAAHKHISDCTKHKSTTVRIAAIESFRRMEGEKISEDLLPLYTNKKEPTEVRIEAFRSVIKQAGEGQLRKIKHTSEKETDPQVAGYVSTYIRNLMRSSSPWKQNQKQLVKRMDFNLPEVSYWNSSKNIESSIYSQMLKAGAAVEIDLIKPTSSKSPLSIRTNLAASAFKQDFDLLETKWRAKGIQELVKSFIESVNTEHKFPDLRRLTKDLDMQMHVRILNNEVFGISSTDLSGLSELFKMSDIFEKLARERRTDFSHSFVFLNSKLVIPSMTGRSYSIELSGSSTVGLSAESKVDLLRFPRDIDVKLHFKPRVNVEVWAKVGILSSHYKPGLKYKTRLYFESDLKANAQIKDGHLATVSVSLPSENVVVAKMSTDIVEIDSDNNERRLFDKMQTKVDYCFNQLKKTLGLSACSKIEVAKPFVTRSPPYIAAVGNVEFSLKKSDLSFSSYVLRAEIPKQLDSQMKYLISLDTPGSKVSRRLVAGLDVEQHEGHKKLSLELTSPFKTLRGTGSYTLNDKIIKGKLDIQTGSKKILLVDFKTEISTSRSRKFYDTHFKGVLMDYEPVQLKGNFTVTKGRKHHINFGCEVNGPKPLRSKFRGTIMKEGQLSQNSEWKISTDISVNSHLGDLQVRKILQNKSKKSQDLSINLDIDYKEKDKTKRETIKFITAVQRNSGKSNTNIKFEVSELPELNWYFTCDVLDDSRHRNMKTDIFLKYGEKPNINVIHFKHTFKTTSRGHSESLVIFEIPHEDVHYELSTKHFLEFGDTVRLHIDVDLCYEKEKHATTVIDINYTKTRPLKANSRVEVHCPGGHYIYEDKTEETRKGVFEGNARYQYEEGKAVEIKYKYKLLSNESAFHHAIEASLLTPLSQNLIHTKASLQSNTEFLALSGEVGPKYSVEAHYLSRSGVAQFSLKAPEFEGSLKGSSQNLKNSLDVDLKLNTRDPKHFSASGVVDLRNKKQVKFIIIPDVNRLPDRKFYLSSIQEVSGEKYKGSTELQLPDLLKISLTESGDISFYGSQDCALDIWIKNLSPISLVHKHEIGEGKVDSVLIYSKNHEEKVKIELEGNVQQDRSKREISAKVAVTSLDKSFEDMELHVIQQYSSSGRSSNIKSIISFIKNKEVYKAELNSDLQPDGIEVKAEMNTPVPSYEKRLLGISYQNSKNEISSSISIETPNNKILSITSEIKKKRHGFIASWEFKSPLEYLREGVAYVAVDDHLTKTVFEAYLHVNNKSVIDYKESETVSSHETERKAVLKLNTYFSYIQGVEFNYKENKTTKIGKADVLFHDESKLHMNLKNLRDHSVSVLFTLTPPTGSVNSLKVFFLCENELNKKNVVFYIENRGRKDLYIGITTTVSSESVEFQGRLKAPRIPEISTDLKLEKSRESYSIRAKILKGELPLFFSSVDVILSQREQKLSVKADSHENTVLNLEISSHVSGDSSKKFSLRANGSFPPITITITNDRKEENSASTEIRLCTKIKRSVCYILKAKHKLLINSGNYRFSQKVTMDFERSVHGSNTEALGSFHVLLEASERDYRSKVTLLLQERTLGYDVKLHGRKAENDYCTLDAHLYLPQYTSKLRASILHNDNRVHADVEVVPVVEQPTRKLSFELKKETNRKSKENSGYIKLNHPGMSQPFLFTCKFQELENHLIRLKMVMHYSSAVGKTLTAEINPNFEQESSGLRTMDFKLYTEDKSTDVFLRLLRQSTSHMDRFGYEWKCSCGGNVKKGEVLLTLLDKKNGKPRSFKLIYSSPSSDIAFEGSAAQAPEDISLSLLSKGQKVNEIRFKTADSCASVEILRSGPLVKSTVCVNRLEGSRRQLVKVDIFYRKFKCLDACVSVDTEHPSFVDVSLNWKKEDIRRAVRELSEWEDLIHLKSIREVLVQLKTKIEHFRRNVLLPHFRNIWKNIREIEEDILRRLKHLLNYHFDQLKEHAESLRNANKSLISYLKSLINYDTIVNDGLMPIIKLVDCFVRGYVRIVYDHIHDVFRSLYETSKSHLRHCLKKFCPPGTVCHKLVHNYRNLRLEHAQVFLSEKISQTARFLQWPEMFHDIFNWVHERIHSFKEKIESIFGKIVGDTIYNQMIRYVKKFEKSVRTEVIKEIDLVIDEINNLLNGDEDYQTAKYLVSDAKKEVVKAWHNRHKLVEDTIQPIKENISQNAQKLAQEYFQVEKYEPERGHIEFKVRQLLDSSEIEALKSEFSSVSEKLQEFARS
ncbi:apolipophorins [Nephila pilipes]|uniref:Apolipophorins n=1 Tax=Nephila pilipes TaxID=299642 RepID=A0A8X6QNG4_NEPPI|nr:apolipophorins [Nephila pilipes]